MKKSYVKTISQLKIKTIEQNNEHIIHFENSIT